MTRSTNTDIIVPPDGKVTTQIDIFPTNSETGISTFSRVDMPVFYLLFP